MRLKNPQVAWRRWGNRATIFIVLFSVVFGTTGLILRIPSVHAAATCPADTTERKINNTLSECTKGLTRVGVIENGVYKTETERTADSCNSFASCIANVVYLFTVGLGGAVAYVGAWMLSLTIALSLQSVAYALGFLSGAWTVIRDVANMFFILILVYIAFTIMLRADTANTMKHLAWVIVMALLINFSFFFTRVVIDAGNLLAVQFYNAIEGPSISAAAAQTNLQGVVASVTSSPYAGIGADTKDLTASIMDGVGIQKILSNESFKKFQADSDWLTELIALSFIYIATGVMFFMLAAAYFAVAIKFLVRTVVLWLAIIFSPLAFVANTLEGTKKAFQFWVRTLFTHSFYPAVFLLLFYLLTLLMRELRGGIGSTDTIVSKAFGDVSGLTSSGLNYMVAVVAILAVYLGFVLIMLYLSLKASDLMDVWFKDASGGFARWATRIGSNAGYGGAAWLGRQTLGRLSASAAQSARMRGLEIQGKRFDRPTNNLLTRIGGKVMQTPRNILQNVAQGSFDVRSLPGTGTAEHLLRNEKYGLKEDGRINYDPGKASKGNVNRTQQASNALRRRGNGVPVPPQGPPPAPVPVGGPGPLTPPPLAVHATVPPESPQLVKVEKAVKELTYKMEESASATSHLTRAVEKPQLTHSSNNNPALEERLKGVEEALLSRSTTSGSAPKQITYQPGQTMPIDIEMTKQKDGSFSMSKIDEAPENPKR